MENDLNDEQKAELAKELAEDWRDVLKTSNYQPSQYFHVTINDVYQGVYRNDQLITLYNQPHLEGAKIEYRAV